MGSQPPFKVELSHGFCTDYDVSEIDFMRSSLHSMGLIGYDPAAEDTYGSVSRRVPHYKGFSCIATATKTGGMERLSLLDYVVVLDCDPARKIITAEGCAYPSRATPALWATHMGSGAEFAAHYHNRGVWDKSRELGLPTTMMGAGPGSYRLFQQIGNLFEDGHVMKTRAFAIGAEKDGLIVFGSSPEEVLDRIKRYADEAERLAQHI